MLQIEFKGRAVHIETEHGALVLFPAEVFELVRWAKDHEFALIGKQHEMQRIAEAYQPPPHSYHPPFPEKGNA